MDGPVSNREQPAWAVVCDQPGRSVRRFKVPGGWLYQVEILTYTIDGVVEDTQLRPVRNSHHTGWHPPVFVPDTRQT